MYSCFVRATSRRIPLAILAVALLGPVARSQQHGQPIIEPRTREGAMLSRIQQEQDKTERTKLLNEFTRMYPRSRSTLWVLESLHAAYLAAGNLDAAITVGQRALALYPADIDTAQSCLKAAESLGNFELIRKFAMETWKRASWLRKREDAEGQSAREAMGQAEYALSLAALQDPSAENRQNAIATLARLNPHSTFLPTPANSSADRIAPVITRPRIPALKGDLSALDLENVDALIAEAERLTRQGANYWKVLDYSQRAIKILEEQTAAPAGEDPVEWQSKHNRYLTGAYFMSGMAATILGRYSVADRHLRAALPTLQGNQQALGLTLYSLGYVNYRLAEDGERKRIFDALKFNQQCAAIPGAYREQARQNIESIRIYYNMK